jgi:hypothetical protein
MLPYTGIDVCQGAVNGNKPEMDKIENLTPKNGTLGRSWGRELLTFLQGGGIIPVYRIFGNSLS